MNSFATLFIYLALSLGIHSVSTVALSAASDVTDASSQDCEDAKKLAATGVFHGSQISNGQSSDKCIAAVYDPSHVSVVEANPQANPKNFRCVGKNVRLMNSLSSGTMVTESWSAAAGVPAGKCSVVYCEGSTCADARMVDGMSSNYSSNASYDPGAGADTQASEDSAPAKNMEFDATLAQIDQEQNPPLSKRIDDAFSDISATQYQKDASGIPDVTKPAYPELQNEFSKIDYDNYQTEQFEKQVIAPEIRNSEAYQAMVGRSNQVQALSPNQYHKEWVEAGFSESEPLTDVPGAPQKIVSSGQTGPTNTFASADGHFYDGFRMSQNVEEQTWSSYVVSNTQSAFNDVKEWVQETASSIKSTVSGFFVR